MPTELLSVFVRGLPAGMPRPRARAIPNGHGGHIATVYQPTTEDGHTLPWKAWHDAILRTVRSCHRGQALEGLMRLDCDVFFTRPERLLKPKSPLGKIGHGSKPDGDNVWKLIADALTEAEVWKDDSQISECEIRKYYVARGDASGARIVVTRLDDPEPCIFMALPAPR